jgi:hypothetical protein
VSYDLFFSPKEGAPPPAADDVRAWFAARPHYDVSEEQAVYENDDTGVYFVFEPAEGDAGEDEGGWTFNINFARPHVFGLEAEPELTAFVRQFGWDVVDPQDGGMEDGTYTPEGFLAGWNSGNEFGIGAMLSHGGLEQTDHVTLPRAEVARIWKWNLGRATLQERVGGDVFVPPILVVKQDGRARSMTVWGDAMPIALPEVEIVACMREELAPRRLLVRRPDMALLPYRALGVLLRHARRVAEPAPHLVFAPQQPAVVDFFRAATPHPGELEAVSFDHVLDAELVDAVRARRASAGS